MEYYILCPQRATEVPGLITHLISRDICERRQSENYHKCPGCIRSRVWREQRGHPEVAALNGIAKSGSAQKSGAQKSSAQKSTLNGSAKPAASRTPSA